jgi:hypothetical protein
MGHRELPRDRTASVVVDLRLNGHHLAAQSRGDQAFDTLRNFDVCYVRRAG